MGERKSIKGIVYELEGKTEVLIVGEDIADIQQIGETNNFKVFNTEGFHSFTVFGVKEVHYDLTEAYERDK